jgi:hypothetical protein
VKDLEHYELLKKENQLLQSSVNRYKDIVSMKDSTITQLELQTSLQAQIISNNTRITEVYKSQLDELTRMYKRSVRTSRFKTILLAVVTGVAGYLLITK